MKPRFATLLICAWTGVLISACGGGGGGPGGGVRVSSVSDFETAEFNRQEGLTLINAQNMYARGGTGSNVLVGVADSGINSTETNLSSPSQIDIDATKSFNFEANTSGTASDDNGHGTHVAGIIAAPKNDFGMHGIAFDSQIVNYRVINAANVVVASDAQLAQMLSSARADDVDIINNSWGSSVSITEGGAGAQVAALSQFSSEAQNYVANGGVIVFAAGNDSKADPSAEAGIPQLVGGLESGWIVAMAVDLDGLEPNYTNRCGVSANYCIAAPGGGDFAGTGILSMSITANNTTRLSGTSMAAPHVSGAVAALKSMFPTLSLQQVRTRLFATANKAGIYANSNIFGQGLMDLDTASSPVGGVAIPTGSNVNGAATNLNGNQVASGQAASHVLYLPHGIEATLALEKHVLVIDNFQRAPFLIPSTTFVRPSLTAPSLQSEFEQYTSDDEVIFSDENRYVSRSSDHYRSLNLSAGSFNFGYAVGTYASSKINKDFGLSFIPKLQSRGIESSITLGFSRNRQNIDYGIFYTDQIEESLTQNQRDITHRSPLGAFRSLSLVADKQLNSSTGIGYSLTLADRFERPLGFNATGVFSTNSEPSAIGWGFGVNKTLTNQSFSLTLDVESFSETKGPLVSRSRMDILTTGVAWSSHLYDFGRFYAKGTFEEFISGETKFRLPTDVTPDGEIRYVSYAFDQRAHMTRNSISGGWTSNGSNRLKLGIELSYHQFGSLPDVIGGFSKISYTF